MLIISIVFTVCPLDPAYALDDNTHEKVPVSIFIQRDIRIENEIIRHTITEKIFTDGLLGENILIEKGLRHTLKDKNPVKTQTNKLQPRKQKNFNQNVRTLDNLV